LAEVFIGDTKCGDLPAVASLIPDRTFLATGTGKCWSPTLNFITANNGNFTTKGSISTLNQCKAACVAKKNCNGVQFDNTNVSKVCLLITADMTG
jgi:hypothetical protein